MLCCYLTAYVWNKSLWHSPTELYQNYETVFMLNNYKQVGSHFIIICCNVESPWWNWGVCGNGSSKWLFVACRTGNIRTNSNKICLYHNVEFQEQSKDSCCLNIWWLLVQRFLLSYVVEYAFLPYNGNNI